MKTNEEIKSEVRKKYSQIATQNNTGCCGTGESCNSIDYSVFSDDYSKLEGYLPNADLGLGCGLPTQFAKIKEGQTVLDLGSGAGNDCFVARHAVGEEGKVIGLDFTESMIGKAKLNAEKLGYNNVEFLFGEIEKMPINSESVDVIVSNCVMNLVPDKKKAFSETYRVLKEGGHFSISDVVLKGELPEVFRENAELWAGCISGALPIEEYLGLIEDAGFKNIEVQTEKKINLPADIYANLPKDQIEEFVKSDTGIYSITVYAEKPSYHHSCCCCS